ncbi:hypothetical protein CCACVL1_15499 [Corchorus capsularis]|uniref:Protein kinase domain-containing protein n=1 Tax=Corchorus capsularis TaxID=210143 RepID=A0A1R3I276_COCAP|nr:hypothetical protein CCACVL1_15499 [Corchorus capsularis]
MEDITLGLIFGIIIGLVFGVVGAVSVMICIWYRKKVKKHSGNNDEESVTGRGERIPIRLNGENSSTIMSDSNPQEASRTSDWSNMPQWLEGLKSKSVGTACGIPKYSYKELQKVTYNFSTNIGQGAFGPVYKAQMATGQTVAVKVLATDSKQGANEFLSEVLLLGRLHHRNLVSLVGYMAEKGMHMLVYAFMSNGSLATRLYSEKYKPLSWDLRVRIALDVARGLEYLHYGAVPPVVHRDVKSANILLDASMRARVADFGLSRQEKSNNGKSAKVKGTFGYVDPEYASSLNFNKKSDVYSYGILLFEIISGKNPQKNLMEFVELAAIDVVNDSGWHEIADPRLKGKFDLKQLNFICALAYDCVKENSNLRPSMREIVVALTEICKLRNSNLYYRQCSRAKREGTTFELDLQDKAGPSQTPVERGIEMVELDDKNLFHFAI